MYDLNRDDAAQQKYKDNLDKLLLEAHLFDFNMNIYGKYLTVEFLAFIRDEQKFENFDKLTQQIHKDIQTAKNYHLKK